MSGSSFLGIVKSISLIKRKKERNKIRCLNSRVRVNSIPCKMPSSRGWLGETISCSAGAQNPSMQAMAENFCVLACVQHCDMPMRTINEARFLCHPVIIINVPQGIIVHLSDFKELTIQNYWMKQWTPACQMKLSEMERGSSH